ncbi:YdcF family protein [Curtobacterium pusillum]|uniref:YdcF family protein n=1 Tax=Curtobacterium pusillum TaxID=69373 RepID=UPI0021B1B785|nr:YdcF family protein [Curtobacterium pusillum]
MLVAALIWGEWVHCSASRTARRLPSPTAGSRGAVVPLGFGNRAGRPNAVNRWRARIAVRTARQAEEFGATVTIICSGGAVHGPQPEAVLLRRYIVGRLRWRGPIQVERDSSSTWENVRNVLPLIEQSDWIAFASNGLHAAKARVYLARQRPNLAGRLVPADDYRLGEMTWMKPLFAAVGLAKLRAVFHVERSGD